MRICPNCKSINISKNGKTHYGKENNKCTDCGRQFVEGGMDWFVSDSEKVLINKLLLERISLSGICRVCNVSESWLLIYIKKLYGEIPSDLGADLDLPDIENYLSDKMDEEIGRITVLKKIRIHLKSTCKLKK